ncbi:MAG: hypothetical protein ACYTBJ_14755 [Planctomycetota bacterium]|jgi:hypothetical protein
MDRLIGRFRENYRGFWEKYHCFFAVFVLSLLCDAASTMHFMLREGPDVEIHIVIRLLSKSLGPVAGPLVGAIGKILAGIVVTVYFRRWAGYIFVTASIISFWAAWYNIWGFRIYTPIILQWFTW